MSFCGGKGERGRKERGIKGETSRKIKNLTILNVQNIILLLIEIGLAICSYYIFPPINLNCI